MGKSKRRKKMTYYSGDGYNWGNQHKPTAQPEEHKTKVVIDWVARQKIMRWVMSTTQECSGLGKVVVEGPVIKVTDAYLLPQRNSGASTDIDAADVTKAMYELREVPGNLQFWWHSHADMGVFWSGTDHDTMRMIGSNGWCLSSVFNRRNESKTAIYLGKPFPIFIDDIKLNETTVPIAQELLDQWDAEFKAKVKPAYTAPAYQSSGYGSYHRFWDPVTRKYFPLWPTASEEAAMNKRQIKLMRKERGFRSESYAKNDTEKACLLCGWVWSCKCPKELVQAAQEAADKGECIDCRKPEKECCCEVEDTAIGGAGTTDSTGNSGTTFYPPIPNAESAAAARSAANKEALEEEEYYRQFMEYGGGE
jgi:hypothetical protein